MLPNDSEIRIKVTGTPPYITATLIEVQKNGVIVSSPFGGGEFVRWADIHPDDRAYHQSKYAMKENTP